MKAFRVIVSIRTQRYTHREPFYGGPPPSEVWEDHPILVYAYTSDQAQEVARAFYPKDSRVNIIGCKEIHSLDPPPASAEEDT